jgi:hypothetical protein
MKRRQSKLVLHRETLVRLDPGLLRKAGAGAYTLAYTAKNPPTQNITDVRCVTDPFGTCGTCAYCA